jgi:hypothetical protein
MIKEKWMELEFACRELQTKGKDLFKWQWNARVNAVSTSFHIKDKDQVLSILSEKKASIWNRKNIADADAVVKQTANTLGGLWDNQQLFTYPGTDIGLAIAWWPWLNGQTVSLVLIPMANQEIPEDVLDGLMDSFRAWFNA